MTACFWFVVLFNIASLALAQSEAEFELYEKLLKGPGSIEAFETVVKRPDAYSGLVLYAASAVALKEERIEDSGFLFYAAQLRSRFDKICFPPEGTGGNDPFLVNANLSMMIGSAVNPAVMDDPPVFQRVLDRLEKWRPKAPTDYDPGYDHKERKTEKEAIGAAKANRDDFITHMAGICTLLKDKEYLAASRVERAYNMADEEERPTKEEHDKAIETMKRIENEKGIEGLVGVTKK